MTLMRSLTHLSRIMSVKGMTRTFQSIVSFIEDYYFDKKYGIDTSEMVQIQGLDISDESKKHSRRYQPTRVRHFRELMKTLEFPAESVFVDLGSGKGRVLLMASQHKFRRVVGVEISKQLCEIARRNIVRYEAKIGTLLNVTIVESDVLEYEIGYEENVFFLFKPFDNYVMKNVMENIKASLASSPRDIWLIFNNFRYHDLMDEDSTFARHKSFSYGGARFVIYTSFDYRTENLC